MPLTARDRARRTATLCGHCLRNIAFYRAGRHRLKLRITREFWKGANGNCIDLALLEWCKLFADSKGKHHWSKTITDQKAFMLGLHARLGYSEAQFNAYVESVRHLRDKFIAHLDDEKTMFFPLLRPARASVAYLFNELLTGKDAKQWFTPQEAHLASKVYSHMYKHAVGEHRAAQAQSKTS
jgi:hypothetical protein